MLFCRTIAWIFHSKSVLAYSTGVTWPGTVDGKGIHVSSAGIIHSHPSDTRLLKKHHISQQHRPHHHQCSKGNISVLLALCEGIPPVTGGFPSKRLVTLSFDIFFYLRLRKRLSKHSRRWWIEMSSPSLWRHNNAPHNHIFFPSVITTSIPSFSKWTILAYFFSEISKCVCTFYHFQIFRPHRWLRSVSMEDNDPSILHSQGIRSHRIDLQKYSSLPVRRCTRALIQHKDVILPV